VTLFLTSDLQGAIEPCGCTTDPLGDLARTAKLIEDAASAGAVLHLDAGSTLYSELSLAKELVPQEERKATLIRDTFQKVFHTAAVGLGPYDLSLGTKGIQMPRHAANVTGEGIPLSPPTVLDAKGTRIGVFGVVSASGFKMPGAKVSDPLSAAKDAVALLRQQKADVIVVLAHMSRQEVAKLVRAVPGIHFAVVGQTVPQVEVTPKEAPDQVGDTWLIELVDRGQVLTRLDLTFRQPGPWADAIGKTRAAAAEKTLAASIARAQAELSEWKKSPDADPAFLKEKEKAVAEAIKERQTLIEKPLRVPAKDSWFVYTPIKIKKALPCSPAIQASKETYDKDVGTANVAAAKGKKAPPPPKGTAGYVGTEECANCHSEAFELWEGTRHAHAWKTLTDLGKAQNYDCIGCHVTGWDKPGGATMGHHEPFQNVQCETCHGPGSLHMEADGDDQRRTIPRVPDDSLFKGCHNEKHSDTFAFEAYLRDVTGPGHGEEFRKKLGDGPTGKELRSAGFAKAGKSIGAGCRK